MDTGHIDLLSLTGSTLKKTAGTNGGEYSGACPFCGGTDRFRVWPHPRKGNPLMWCRQCGFTGDAIAFVMKRDSVDFRAACDVLGLALDDSPPRQFVNHAPARRREAGANLAGRDWIGLNDSEWQRAAGEFITRSFDLIECERPASAAAREHLETARRLGVHVTDMHRIGWNPEPVQALWGEVRVWLPAGIVIPWEIDGKIWRVNVRRMDGGSPKYIQPAGCANGLFNADRLKPGCIAVIVEGEFDALAIEQGQPWPMRFVPVATGSTMGARLYQWVGKLALCSRVIIAFDSDQPGESAAAWWLKALPRSIRKRPTAHDVSDMLSQGHDIYDWLRG